MERTVWSDERLDDRFRGIDDRLDRIEHRLDLLEQRMARLEDRMVQIGFGLAGMQFVGTLTTILALS
jgi:hypothetical protein